MKRVTITDVAKQAGVSHATVERVLQKKSNVSENAKARVIEAIAQMNYVPNRFASGLRNKKSNILLHVGMMTQSGSFASVTTNLIRCAIRYGYDVISVPIALDVPERHRLRSFEDMLSIPADGFIFSNIHGLQQNEVDFMHERGIASVLMERVDGLIRVDSVSYNAYAFFKNIVKKLFHTGHRKIAFLGVGPLELLRLNCMESEEERLKGYLSGIEDCGLDPVLEYVDKYDMATSEVSTRKLLERVGGIDAIVTTSDSLACGALRTIKNAEQENWHAITVTGFGNTWAQALSEPIITVDIPYMKMAEIALQMITSRIKDPCKPFESARVELDF